jgi:hypothetical protein
MRQELAFWVLVVLLLTGLAGMFRIPWAVRFWIRIRRLGYIYVALIVVLAILSAVLGRRL